MDRRFSDRPLTPNPDGTFTDEETGEIFGIEDSRSLGFLKIFTEDLWRMMNIANINVRVLLFLIREMKKYNYVNMTQAQIAKALDHSRKQIQRAISELEKTNLVVPGRGTYQVNPSFIFLGNEKDRIIAKHVYDTNRQKKFERKLK